MDSVSVSLFNVSRCLCTKEGIINLINSYQFEIVFKTAVWIYFSTTTVMIQEEYLLYDMGTVVAAVGGNLGLFIGFSCLNLFEMMTTKLYFMFKK
jgi:Amiloride-sensitive sodium channel